MQLTLNLLVQIDDAVLAAEALCALVLLWAVFASRFNVLITVQLAEAPETRRFTAFVTGTSRFYLLLRSLGLIVQMLGYSLVSCFFFLDTV